MPTVDDLFATFRATGDPTAFAGVYDETVGPLFRLALTLAPGPAAAEDALQETYLAAIEHAGGWDARRPLTPWLVGVLRHKLTDARRRDARHPVSANAGLVERGAEPKATADPFREAVRGEENDTVRRALADLPEPYRMPALLRWRHGLEPGEIADLTGRSPGAVRVTLHRALERLRRRLGATLAVLPFGTGGPAPRGLDAVRSYVLDAARTAPRRARWRLPVVAATAVVAVGLLAALVVSAASRPSTSVAPGSAPSSVAVDDTPHPRVVLPARSQADGADDTAAPGTDPGTATAAAPTGPVVDGRVLTAGGAPVPGATVVAFPQDRHAIRRLTDLLSATHDVGRTRTTDDGHFAVPAPADSPDTLFDVVVLADGFAIAAFAGQPAGASLGAELRAARSPSAVVVAPDAAPVVGATVRGSRHLSNGVLVSGEATTDADGRFELSDRLAGAQITLEIRAAGFAPFAEVLPEELLRRTPPATLQLLRGTPLSGTVVDAVTGAPLVDAEVVLGHQAAPELFRRSRWIAVPYDGPRSVVVATRTDPRGHFRFAAVPSEPGAVATLYIRARAAGHVASGLQLGADLQGDDHEVRLALPPTATARGHVVDAEGTPVPHARLDVQPLAQGWFPLAWLGSPGVGPWETDAIGRFDIAVPASSDSSLTVRIGVEPPTGTTPDGRAWLLPRPPAIVTLSPGPGAVVDLPDMVLPAPTSVAHVHVRVVDEAGAPVVAGHVSAVGVLGDPAAMHGDRLRLDADGAIDLAFTLDPARTALLARDNRRHVIARAPGHAPNAASFDIDATTDLDLEIVLHPAMRLTGRVREADGRPAAGAWVVATCEIEGAALSFTAAAGDDGTFAMDDVLDCPLGIQVQPPAGVEVRTEITNWPTPARPGEPLEITLAPRNFRGTGALDVAVADATSGRPIAGFSVTLVAPEFGIDRRAPRYAPGRLHLDGVASERFVLTVSASGYLSVDVPVEIEVGATTRREFALERALRLTGRVRLPGDVPTGRNLLRLAPVRQRVLRPGGDPGMASAWITGDATFTLDRLRPGRFRATMSTHPGYAGTHAEDRVPHEFALRAGATVDVEDGAADSDILLDLEPAGRLLVHVASSALPAPREDASPVATAELPEPVGRIVVCDSAGRVELDRVGLWRGVDVAEIVPPGEHVVRVETPGRAPWTKTVDVTVDETTELSYEGE